MITILTREDLTDRPKRVGKGGMSMNFDEITLYEQFYFPSREIVLKSSFIVYIHDDRQFKILKNRYPDDSPETNGILDLLKLK